MQKTLRINKYLAEYGLASRREADILIESGQVLVNGKTAILGQKVNIEDKVEVIGVKKKKQYLAYYKANGVITHSPAEFETDIQTRLKNDYGITGVYPVGRLDKKSEGLIILTNDGRITDPLLNPKMGHEKEYIVTVDKEVTNFFLKRMSIGVNIEGYITKPAKAKIISSQNKRRFLLVITEGKKHQIRRMCAALGYQVHSLKRIRIINIELKNLKPNQYRKITGQELKDFLQNLNVK